MNDYVIINGVNSNTISGLKISKLPPITKPQMRTLIEAIDGRDGDLITDLGYSAYDKQLEIGLWGTYDINEIISFFNQEGTITFSNEADKFYNFKIINQIDYQKLLKFKTAVVVMHCQPFKYPTTETPIEGTATTITGEGESLTLNNTLEAPLEIDLKGNTYQNGEPTPDTPIDIQVVSGDNTIKVEGKNLLDSSAIYSYSIQTGTHIVFPTNDRYAYLVKVKSNTSYVFSRSGLGSASLNYIVLLDNFVNGSNNSYTTAYNLSTDLTKAFTTEANTKYVMVVLGTGTSTNMQLEKGSQSTTYTPYVSQTYPINLPVKNKCSSVTKPANANLKFFIDKPAQTFTISFTTNEELNSNSLYLEVDNVGKGNLGGITASANTRVEKTYTLSNENYQAILNGTNIDLLLYKNGANFTIPNDAMVEDGSKANSYTPYGTTPIELCKIGDYQDRIYKDNGKWYLNKQIGKVVLDGSEGWWKSSKYQGSFYLYDNSPKYDGLVIPYSDLYCNYFTRANISSSSQISSNYTQGTCFIEKSNGVLDFWYDNGTASISDWETWLGTHNVITYFPLATPTNTEITNTSLLEQLNALEGARSYDNQTNINQTNNDYPFWLSASTTFNAPIVINNIGNIYAKPILELEGSGNITINLNSQDILAISLGETTTKIVIDIPNLEAYNPTDSTLMNRLVVGDYMKFLINSGNNTLKIDGNITSYRLTSYTRWL